MDHSPLQKLPAELRNYIGELVLCQSSRILVKEQRILRRSKRPRFLLISENKHMLAFAQTCKQLRAETVSLFYSGNSFVIEVDPVIWSRTWSSLVKDTRCLLDLLTEFLKVAPDRGIGSLDVTYGPIFDYQIGYSATERRKLFELLLTAADAARLKMYGRFTFHIDLQHDVWLQGGLQEMTTRVAIDGASLQESLQSNQRVLLELAGQDDRMRNFRLCRIFAGILRTWEKWIVE